MLVFFDLLVWSVTYRDEYTEDEIFIRTESGLTEVPTDIPSGAKQVTLEDSRITTAVSIKTPSVNFQSAPT